MDIHQLRVALLVIRDRDWLISALNRVDGEPDAVIGLFTRAARHVGTAHLPGAPGWTADTAAQTLLLAGLTISETHVLDILETLYRWGDTTHKVAVLRALPMLDIGKAAVPLLHKAIASSDDRLLAAALGPYAEHLDPTSWRQAVLKCVYLGTPLSAVHALDTRADSELADHLNDNLRQRHAAGLESRADVIALRDRIRARNGGK